MTSAAKRKPPHSREVSIANLDSFLAQGELKPIHPGAVFRNLVLKKRNLSVVDVANEIEVSRNMLYKIFNGESGLTAATALGFARIAGNEAEDWLRLQAIWDLWHERERRGRLVHAGASGAPASRAGLS